MMDKFKYLIMYSLRKRIKTKAFLISNIIFLALIITLSNLPNIIKAFGGDFSDTKNIYVIDETGDTYNLFTSLLENNKFNNCNGCYNFEEINDIDYKSYIEDKDDYVIRLYYNKHVLEADIFAKSEVSTSFKTSLSIALNQTKSQQWIKNNPVENIEELLNPIVMKYNFIEESDRSFHDREILMAISMAIIVPIFGLLVFVTQIIGMDILDEKASKSIEIIISNVSSSYHFFSKIISAIVFTVIQALLLFIYVAIGVIISMKIAGINMFNGSEIASYLGTSLNLPFNLINDSIISRLPSIVSILLLYILFGYMFFLVIMVIFSSMTTNMEDYQQFQGPLMVLMLASFYSAIFTPLFEGSNFIKALGYIPIFSPMLAPVLYISGQFTVLSIIISLLILIITNSILIYVGLRIYKVSILSYSQDPFLKRLKNTYKSSKYAD